MKIRSFFLMTFGLVLFLGVGPSPALADTKVIGGKHTIIYDIVNPLGVEFLPDYSNSSFTQKVIQEDEFSKRVMVEIKLGPLNSTAAFPIPSPSLGDMRPFLAGEENIPAGQEPISTQARSLVGGSRTVPEAVSAIFHWIVDNHTYDAGRDTLQDGRSVFLNRRGSCVGFSHLMIAMLRSVGIPARYAHGYLPPGYDWGISKKYWGVQITGGGYHGWVEIYYPDIGWTFSDLLHSKDFVDPFHLLRYTDGINLNPRRIRGGSLDVEEATTFTILKEENATLAIDQFPLPKKDILARKNGEQRFGTIYGRVQDVSGNPVARGNIVLQDGAKIISFEKGIFSLPGLETGIHRLLFKAEGFGTLEKSIRAVKGEVINLNITLPAPDAASPSQPARKPAPKPAKAPLKERK